MLAGIAGLIGSKDLKFYFIDSFGKGCFPCELAWVSSITQLKSF